MKMKFIYSKYFIYPTFFLAFFSLYSISRNYFISPNNKLRILKEDKKEGICKSNDDLYNYFYKNGKYEISANQEYEKMDDNSQIVLDYIESDYKAKYIFKYIWYTGKYAFFFVLLLIIIILSLYYSIASCIRSCNEEDCCNFFNFSCCKNRCFKKTICFLIPFLYFFIFILSVFDAAVAVIAVDKFSGSLCVALQLVDSFIDGETRKTYPRWEGVNYISETLIKLGNKTSENNQEIVNNIYNNVRNYSNINKIWNELIEQSYINNTEDSKSKYMSIPIPKMSQKDEETYKNITPKYAFEWGPSNKEGTILEKIYNEEISNEEIIWVFSLFDKYFYRLLGCEEEENEMKCINNGMMSKLFYTGSEKVLNLSKPVSDFKSKFITPIENIYDQVNSSMIGVFFVVIIFVAVYCILIECLLSFFCCARKYECECMGKFLKWLLCFIYYTSIFIVIIGLVVGIVSGFIGCLIKNMSQVIQHTLTTKNLRDDNPVVFEKNPYIKYLDVCINGDGNLAKELNLTEDFEILKNISNISISTDDIKNDTVLPKSPLINNYIDSIQNKLKENYLNIEYYNVDDELPFNIAEIITEINNYVSGKYAKNKQETCSINEIWSTKTSEEGYTYNNDYPKPNPTTRYLIYLYDKYLYDNVEFDTRYEEACSTDDHPYKTVSSASKKFKEFFKALKVNIESDKFTKEYLDDLTELNEIYGLKNKYINGALFYLINIINQLLNPVKQYITETEDVFSVLNCKFVGNNKQILLNLLYTTTGYYMDIFGIATCILSLSIFVGIIFILIVIKNTKLDPANASPEVYLQTLDDILKGNTLIENDVYNINDPLTEE